MVEPVSTKVVLDLASSSITFATALIQVAGEHKGKARKTATPTLSAFIGALPGAAISAADLITARISALRQDCISGGLNLDNPIGRQGSMLNGSGKRMRDRFPVRVNQIALQVSIFFDDVAALAQWFPRHPVNTKAKAPNVRKSELSAVLSSNHTIGDILDAVQTHVNDAREELRKLLTTA